MVLLARVGTSAVSGGRSSPDRKDLYSLGHGLRVMAFLFAAMSALASALPVHAQTGSARSIPVHFAASVTPSPAHPGEIVTATVQVTIDPGWHVYSCVPSGATGPSASEIVSLGALPPAGATAENPPIRTHDPNFDMDVAYHETSATFRRQFKAAAGNSGGLVFHYQTCNDSICLPPTDVTLNAPVVVAAGAIRTQYATPAIVSSSVGPVRGADTGLGLFLLAALGAGLLALITPCVFPLIPITLTSFAKQAEGDRGKLVRLAVGYASGIIALYVLAGSVVSATLGATGANMLAANPWVNLAEFALFVVFALSFFETITLQLPASLARIQSAARKQSGTAGLMLMGVAFVLASFTCTAPFVGTLLVSAAGGEKLRPLLGMFVFALAFTSPFLLCAIFPDWISRVPKSGAWLARVKATLGFIELAAATKFLSNADQVWQWKVLTQPVLLGLWAMIFFCAFLYLIDLLRFGLIADDPRTKTPLARLAFAGVFLVSTIYCFWGMSGRPISPFIGAFLPPAGYGGVGAAQGALLPWSPDYQASLSDARAAHKPILIDFTGYTCTNCRLNEKNVFPRPDVQRILADFTLVQLYTDGGKDGPSNQQFEEKTFDDVALPLYGVIDSATGAVVDKIAGVVTPAQFEDFLAGAQRTIAATNPGAVPGATANPAAVASGQPWSPLDPSRIGQGKPTLIDFTAAWCVNCHAIEKQVFENPAVAPILASDFVTMRVDLTAWDSPASQAIRKQYQLPEALPAVLMFDASGKEVTGARITGLLSVADFLKKIAPLRGGSTRGLLRS
jgi:thiol:disulfide interchange protein